VSVVLVTVIALSSSSAWSSDVGLAGTVGFRMPLMDLADPLPYAGPHPPVAGARLDVMPGLMVHNGMGWEFELRGRLSGYALVWSNESVAPGHRGAVEVSVRRFVPPNDYRTDLGIWEGGYAGGSVAAEVWGLNPVGPPKLYMAHLTLGYLGLAGGTTPSYLELGWGVWGDVSSEQAGHGPAIRIGAYFPSPWSGEGSEAPKDRRSDRH